MEKDPSKRTNRPGSLTVELLERMEKLEAENKELKEKMKLKLYGTFPNDKTLSFFRGECEIE